MKSWKIVLSFVAVFLAGLFVGAASTLHFAHDHFFKPPHAADMAARILTELRTELKLTPEQVDKIKPIIEKTSAQAEAIHRQVFQQLKIVFDASDESVKAQLTNDQVLKFIELKARRHRPPEQDEKK